MRPQDYEFIRDLVYKRSRINLGSDKKELVSARLGKRLRATGLPSIQAYCHFLQNEPGADDELSHLIDAISTNHTYFFREPEHFDFLRDHIIPEMIKRRRTERWSNFRVWSAASSSGEEGYTIAITLAESLAPAAPDWPWRIEGTDISTRMLEKGRNAIYKQETVERMPKPVLKKYFQAGFGPQEGYFRVRQELRSKMTFSHLNLLEGPVPFTEPFQVIFCRNVMIYFDRPTQEELVKKLTRHLVPGGYLLVGHSESLTGISHGLALVKPAIYRRP